MGLPRPENLIQYCSLDHAPEITVINTQTDAGLRFKPRKDNMYSGDGQVFFSFFFFSCSKLRCKKQWKPRWGSLRMLRFGLCQRKREPSASQNEIKVASNHLTGRLILLLDGADLIAGCRPLNGNHIKQTLLFPEGFHQAMAICRQLGRHVHSLHWTYLYFEERRLPNVGRGSS